TVSNAAPTVTLSASNDLSVNEGTTHTYSFTITDPGQDGVTAVSVSCGANGSPVGIATFTDNANGVNSGSFQCAFADGPATSTVSASATDSDGATGNSATQTVTVNNVAPTVAFTNGDSTANESSSTQHTYSYSISDPGQDSVSSVTTSCGANGT